jgi:segregation and condensation protein A
MDESAAFTEAEPATPVAVVDLVLALDGFEGPIDLLLNLARDQKVDLGKISILGLAEQYLAYITQARKLRLEVAADYLVMAAWLAYLKSRLLLPQPPEDGPNPADMAEALKFQLQRLEAMQKAANSLQDLPRLGIDNFLRGKPEEIEVEVKPVYYLPISDLLTALAAPLRRRKPESYNIKPMRLYSLEESMERLHHLLGVMPSWSVLQEFLPETFGTDKIEQRSAIASTFAATLELVKNGKLELRQDGTFAPIYLRRRDPSEHIIEEQVSEE